MNENEKVNEKIRTEIMGIFDKSNQKKFQQATQTRSSSDYDYLQPGRYFARIDSIKDGETQEGVDFVACDMTIVKVIDDNAGQGHKVGDNVSWITLAKTVKKAGLTYFYKDVANFFGAVMNEDSEAFENGDTGLSDCEVLLEREGNPMAGFVLEIHAKGRTYTADDGTIKTVTANKPFKGRLSIDEVEEELEEDVINKYFPNDILDELRETEESLED